MNISLAMIVWLVLAIGFFVIEGMTVSLVSVWFAIGAAAALIASAFTSSWLIQILIFLVVSAIVMASLRPYALKHVKSRTVSTNAQSNVGKTAEVIAPITPERPGRVRLEGVDWNARCTQPLPAGRLCRVTALEGTTLTVEPAESEATVS